MTPSEPIHFLRRCVATLIAGVLILPISGAALAEPEKSPDVSEVAKPAPAVEKEATPPAKDTKPAGEKVAPGGTGPATEGKPAEVPEKTAAGNGTPLDPDDEVAAEKQETQLAAVARPVLADPVQIFGWREHILIKGVVEKTEAKLDTGALTSSIHAEEKELFERDGKKWVRFIVTDPGMKKPVRTRIEAPLVRIARIKEPGGESTPREVVKLSFTIGERKMRGEFTLNNRSNMLAPVLIGRNMIKELGWVDPGRAYLAGEKIFR